jgi:hypothetical protein
MKKESYISFNEIEKVEKIKDDFVKAGCVIIHLKNAKTIKIYDNYIGNLEKFLKIMNEKKKMI